MLRNNTQTIQDIESPVRKDNRLTIANTDTSPQLEQKGKLQLYEYKPIFDEKPLNEQVEEDESIPPVEEPPSLDTLGADDGNSLPPITEQEETTPEVEAMPQIDVISRISPKHIKKQQNKEKARQWFRNAWSDIKQGVTNPLYDPHLAYLGGDLDRSLNNNFDPNYYTDNFKKTEALLAKNASTLQGGAGQVSKFPDFHINNLLNTYNQHRADKDKITREEFDLLPPDQQTVAISELENDRKIERDEAIDRSKRTQDAFKQVVEGHRAFDEVAKTIGIINKVTGVASTLYNHNKMVQDWIDEFKLKNNRAPTKQEIHANGGNAMNKVIGEFIGVLSLYKILDPASTVTPGEFGNVKELQSWISRLKEGITKVAKDTVLPDDMSQDILRLMTKVNEDMIAEANGYLTKSMDALSTYWDDHGYGDEIEITMKANKIPQWEAVRLLVNQGKIPYEVYRNRPYNRHQLDKLAISRVLKLGKEQEKASRELDRLYTPSELNEDGDPILDSDDNKTKQDVTKKLNKQGL